MFVPVLWLWLAACAARQAPVTTTSTAPASATSTAPATTTGPGAPGAPADVEAVTGATPAPAPVATPPATTPSATGAPAAQPQPSDARVHVRFLCIAPSPYSNRHDALRAGFGIYLLLRDLIAAHALPIELSYYDASAFFEDTARIQAVLQDPDVLVIGGSTWNQGPAYYVRRFFERSGETYLGGVAASAWATAGGAHTGGEEVVATTLRSLMGMGAATFTLGQKYMVFSTDERLDPPTPGAFALLDLYYMDLFARTIAVTALARQDRNTARKLANALGASPFYYMHGYPTSTESLARYRPLQARLNAAADAASQEYEALRALLATAAE